MFSLATRYLVPVCASMSECGTPAVCISMGVPVALGKAMPSVIALRCCGLLRATWYKRGRSRGLHGVYSRLPGLSYNQELTCWSGQVERDVFSRWPITQRCTISNAQNSYDFHWCLYSGYTSKSGL